MERRRGAQVDGLKGFQLRDFVQSKVHIVLVPHNTYTHRAHFDTCTTTATSQVQVGNVFKRRVGAAGVITKNVKIIDIEVVRNWTQVLSMSQTLLKALPRSLRRALTHACWRNSRDTKQCGWRPTQTLT